MSKKEYLLDQIQRNSELGEIEEVIRLSKELENENQNACTCTYFDTGRSAYKVTECDFCKK